VEEILGDNEQLMRDYFEAWLAHDWDRALSFWDDQVVDHVPGRSRLAGDFQGKAAFLDAYERAFKELGGTIGVVNLHEVLVKGEPAVALVTERAIRGERTLDFNRVVVYHVRDGKISSRPGRTTTTCTRLTRSGRSGDGPLGPLLDGRSSAGARTSPMSRRLIRSVVCTGARRRRSHDRARLQLLQTTRDPHHWAASTPTSHFVWRQHRSQSVCLRCGWARPKRLALDTNCVIEAAQGGNEQEVIDFLIGLGIGVRGPGHPVHPMSSS
jgi:ketosteroid isomerase-like protein